MISPWVLRFYALIVFVGMILQGCSLKPSESVKLHFILDQKPNLKFLQTGQEWAPFSNFVSDFSCYAVNVVGSGIKPMSGQSSPEYYLDRLSKGESCSYYGVTSVTIPSSQNGEVDLMVPSGVDRFIQVIGYNDYDSTVCSKGIPVGEIQIPATARLGAYEIGRARVDLFRSQTISIANQFDGLSDSEKSNKNIYCDSSSNNGDGSSSGGGSSNSCTETDGSCEITKVELKYWVKASAYGLADGANVSGNWNSPDSSLFYGFAWNPTTSGDPSGTYIRNDGSINSKSSLNLLEKGYYDSSVATGSYSGISIFWVGAWSNGQIMGVSDKSVAGSFQSDLNYFSFGTVYQSPDFKFQFKVHQSNGTDNALTASNTDSNYHVHSAVWDKDGAVNQQIRYTIGNTTYTVVGPTSPISFSGSAGATAVIGSGPSGAVLNGKMAEVLIYMRALSTTEETAVRAYLNTKYGL